MIRNLLGILLALGLVPAIIAAQDSRVNLTAEEASIRALIARDADVPYVEDRIFWSGAYKRPSVGSQRAEAFSPTNMSKRKNQKTTIKVERLEVAVSGDMAWEFSYGTLDFDVDESPVRHVRIDTAILRTWKKVNGQWKVAANFSRPLDVDFVPRPGTR